MCEVVKVLERELENSGLIYVYQEGGLPINCKKFCSRRPSIISIRQNSMMSVLKSI